MAVYRSDQAQLTFVTEAAQGGDPEMMEGTAGTGSTTINAAFDAGYASALNKSMIVIHNDDHQHALKEVDGAAAAVASDQTQAFRILKYILEGSLN